MSDSSDEARDARARAERQRRRRAEVFGDVLPEQTSDDTSDETGSSSDDWLRSQVPPHH